MDFEIEFRAVGENTKAGDCIVIRYRESDGSTSIIVVDGGTLDSGAALVDSLRNLHGPSVQVAHVILTHADADHASGLRALLEQVKVSNLWMHVPWNHATKTRPYFQNKNFTDNGLASNLRKEFDILGDLWDLAKAKGVNIYEPFKGAAIGPLRVLSPTPFAYDRLLPQF